jgi:hypothetical protein
VLVGEKTGFSLASDGLDSVSITEPVGVADNFRKMLVQLWQRFFIKATNDGSSVKTFKRNGTLNTTQTYTDAGGVETIGDAS